MSIQTGITEQNASAPDRGILEASIPCDPTGSTGAPLHFHIPFVEKYLFIGMPQAVADPDTGALYYSFIHGAAGSDVRNFKAVDAGNGQIVRPAFTNPEAVAYFNSGQNVSNEKLNGYMNTEKVLRSQSDSTDPAKPESGTIWVPTTKSRLSFSFWCGTGLLTILDQYVIEVYRDINNADKDFGPFGGLIPDVTNAQLIYQYGPFFSVPFKQPVHNAQAHDIPLAAGCNIYIMIRNLSNALATNRMIGSMRFT